MGATAFQLVDALMEVGLRFHRIVAVMVDFLGVDVRVRTGTVVLDKGVAVDDSLVGLIVPSDTGPAI